MGTVSKATGGVLYGACAYAVNKAWKFSFTERYSTVVGHLRAHYVAMYLMCLAISPALAALAAIQGSFKHLQRRIRIKRA